MDQLILTPEERRLREVTEFEFAPERRLEVAEFVLGEIHRPEKRSRRRTFGVLGVVLAMLTLSGGVAYALITSSTASPDDPYVAYCYPSADPTRGDGWNGSTLQAAERPDGSRDPVWAVSICAQLWDIGAVHPPGTPRPVKNTGNPVPELTACIDKRGDTLVLPADPGICARLGFPTLR